MSGENAKSVLGDAWLPLRGVRVADFSLLLPGPFATVIMADLGADVVKVEPPTGDFARQMPVAMFRMANRNKRSMTLDLKHKDAAEVVVRLAKWADVTIEGFRPGVADRIGIGYKQLSALNPRLVYCSLSGYGQTGPDTMHPGHDLNYLAAGGVMALPGHWMEPPKRAGIPIADLVGGSYAAIAILSAITERNVTGRGAYLDLSLAETALSLAVVRHGPELDHHCRDHMYPTNDLFETKDGKHIAFGIVEQHFWQALVDACAEIAPDLKDPRWADEPGRRRHGDELSIRLKALMKTRTADEWFAIFNGHDVPASLSVTPAKAIQNPQVIARKMVAEQAGEKHVLFPVWANGQRGGALRWVAPELGAHTCEMLDGLGYSTAERARLVEGACARRGDGAARGAPPGGASHG